MRRLLVIEDEVVILKALRRLLERNHYEVECATCIEEAVALRPQRFDLILADLRLPGAEGTTIIPAADPVPVIIMTSHASVRSAVDAMRHGAADYISKPFDHDELLLLIENALSRNLLQVQNRALKLNLERAYANRQRVDDTELNTVLRSILQQDSSRFLHLHGEPGTDKEALANAVHMSSTQSDGPFLIIDAISLNHAAPLKATSDTRQHQTEDTATDNTSIEERIQTMREYLQAAHNGTLVLRNPECLTHTMQEHMTRLIQRVMTHQPIRRPVMDKMRLITISDRNMEALQEQGLISAEFADLFSGRQYEVPPLRSRTSDIARLTDRKLRRLEQRYGKSLYKLSEEARAALFANHWPGNVTELESVLTRAIFVARSQTLGVEDLGFTRMEQTDRDLSLDEYFRYFVLRNQGRLSETELASRLGISRKALWERRQKMHLPRETREDPAE